MKPSVTESDHLVSFSELKKIAIIPNKSSSQVSGMDQNDIINERTTQQLENNNFNDERVRLDNINKRLFRSCSEAAKSEGASPISMTAIQKAAKFPNSTQKPVCRKCGYAEESSESQKNPRIENLVLKQDTNSNKTSQQDSNAVVNEKVNLSTGPSLTTKNQTLQLQQPESQSVTNDTFESRLRRAREKINESLNDCKETRQQVELAVENNRKMPQIAVELEETMRDLKDTFDRKQSDLHLKLMEISVFGGSASYQEEQSSCSFNMNDDGDDDNNKTVNISSSNNSNNTACTATSTKAPNLAKKKDDNNSEKKESIKPKPKLKSGKG